MYIKIVDDNGLAPFEKTCYLVYLILHVLVGTFFFLKRGIIFILFILVEKDLSTKSYDLLLFYLVDLITPFLCMLSILTKCLELSLLLLCQLSSKFKSMLWRPWDAW